MLMRVLYDTETFNNVRASRNPNDLYGRPTSRRLNRRSRSLALHGATYSNGTAPCSSSPSRDRPSRTLQWRVNPRLGGRGDGRFRVLQIPPEPKKKTPTIHRLFGVFDRSFVFFPTTCFVDKQRWILYKFINYSGWSVALILFFDFYDFIIMIIILFFTRLPR